MADTKTILPEPHIVYGDYLYESGIIAVVFEGEKGGLERIAVAKGALELADPNKVPKVSDRTRAVDYLTEIGVLQRIDERYYYNS